MSTLAQRIMHMKQHLQQLNLTGQITKHYWTFTTLLAFADTDTLNLLIDGCEFDNIVSSTQLDNTILHKMLDVLIDSEVLLKQDSILQLTSHWIQEIKQIGLTNFIALLRVSFGQSSSFIQDIRQKEMNLGWHYTDDVLLQSQGTISEFVAPCFSAVDEVHALLSKPGSTLVDIGAGVGKISLKFCELYPLLKVIAVEPAAAPYLLASQNITQSQFASQIELRKIYAQDLQEKNSCDVIWFPHAFFIDDTVFTDSLKAIYSALKPGGILISVYINLATQPKYRGLQYCLTCKESSLTELIGTFAKFGFNNIKTLAETARGFIPIIATK